MKFSASNRSLVDLIQSVAAVVGTSPIPALNTIRIQAVADKLVATATNSEMTLIAETGASVSEPGEFCLPAKRLFSVLRELPAGEVSVSVKDKSAEIRAGGSFFRLYGLPTSEFSAQMPAASSFVQVPAAVIAEILNRVSYAISADETRFVLRGIYFDFSGGNMTAVATDGRRLAMVEKTGVAVNADVNFILPAKAATEVLRMARGDGDVSIGMDAASLTFRCGASVVIAKQIEGQFPAFRQIIPSKLANEVTLDREVLAKIVGRVMLVSDPRTPAIKMEFAENNLAVSATSDVGNASENIPVEFSGATAALGFNASFVLAPLRALTEENITFSFGGSMDPGVIKAPGGFLYVVMPMRVG